ncbi:DMT family transporter [Micromonospora auratinigra]|uniref:Permease of the drug/metabolite transporter (DMT) superfamily n=1 Tax=Micromonospora auratinigra TaxID=261654 RepID=A0A1A8Z4J1_9ACTN|nr:EamA family transporter [Micromonospora auratinigra]SBT38698.1 Permease of the drug/metabolite transporter (DMT) superfamily [Micromonospora auratinigra]
MRVHTPSAGVTRRSSSGWWLPVCAGVLWGTGGPSGRLLALETGLSSSAVAAYRLAVGGVLIALPLVLIRRGLPLGARAWVRIAALGILAAAFQACFFAAAARLSVSLATLVTIGTSPILAMTTEWLTGRRRIGWSVVGTTALAVAGLGLLVGSQFGGHRTAGVVTGVVLALMSAASFTVMTFIGARPVTGLDDLAATGFGFVVGASLLVPLALSTSALSFAPSPASIGLLLLLGSAPTAIAYALYFRGLRSVSASTAALMALLEPLVGILLASWLLGDRLRPTGLLGAGLLVGALLLHCHDARRRPPMAAAVGSPPASARRTSGRWSFRWLAVPMGTRPRPTRRRMFSPCRWVNVSQVPRYRMRRAAGSPGGASRDARRGTRHMRSDPVTARAAVASSRVVSTPATSCPTALRVAESSPTASSTESM